MNVSIPFAAGQHTSSRILSREGKKEERVRVEEGETHSRRGRQCCSQWGVGRRQVTRQHLAGERATKVFTSSVARAIPQSHPQALHNSSPVIMSAWHGKTQLCCTGTNQMSVITASFWHAILWQCSRANSDFFPLCLDFSVGLKWDVASLNGIENTL